MSKPNIAKMIELARAHAENGGVAAAEVYYRMVLKDCDPPQSSLERLALGEANLWFARKALHKGRHGEAADWYQRAIFADPLAVDYRVEYCRKALVPMGMFKNARIEAQVATRIDPTCKDAWSILGGVEQALGNVEAAQIAYDKEVALDPSEPHARLDRATLAIDVADYAKAREMCEPIEGKRRGDALHVLAMCEYREGHHERAIELYKQAIFNKCYDPAMAEWNMSLAMHSIGNYEEGWQAHEARGRQKTDDAMRLIMNRFSLPMLTKDDGPCRVHVHQEMGHGDTIAMARYLDLLVELGHDVRCEVNESLVTLFQRSFPRVKVMPRAIDYPSAIGIPEFDKHIPMLSLPALFGTTVDTVPWNGPYLEARAETLAIPPGRPWIGFCWSSGIRKEGLWIRQYGERKSLNEASFAKLASRHLQYSGNWVSLQAGPERAWHKGLLIDLLPQNPTWDDTAAIIAQLDLVITVDTSVAHLAGAMGKPVWVMMHTEGSWHWMTKRLDSPWYPTARLFRQEKPHQWDDVLEQVSTALAAYR